jgi:hypothetical protein
MIQNANFSTIINYLLIFKKLYVNNLSKVTNEIPQNAFFPDYHSIKVRNKRNQRQNVGQTYTPS